MSSAITAEIMRARQQETAAAVSRREHRGLTDAPSWSLSKRWSRPRFKSLSVVAGLRSARPVAG